MKFDVSHPDIHEAVWRALEEDIGPGDITSQACVSPDQMAEGCFQAREELVVAGSELLPVIYQMRGGVDEVRLIATSGTPCDQASPLATRTPW